MLELLVSVLLLAIPVGILFPFGLAVFAAFKWRGGWRLAAFVPLIALVAFFAPMVPDWSRDPTSHNLWGLVFIPVSLVLCGYSIVLAVLYRRRSRRDLQP